MTKKRTTKKATKTAAARKRHAAADTAPPKHLTIDFAGICTLITAKEPSARAEVWLVDVREVLGETCPPHRPTLTVALVDEKPQPLADYTIAVPGDPKEYSVWSLADKTVTIEVEPPPTAPKITQRKSLQGVFDLVDAVPGATLNPKARTAATVVLEDAVLSAWDKTPVKLFFQPASDITMKVGKKYFSRGRAVIPFGSTARIRLTPTGRPLKESITLEFRQATDIVIGNLCQEVPNSPNHFEAHFEVLTGGKRPRLLLPAGGPQWPETKWCNNGRVTIEKW